MKKIFLLMLTGLVFNQTSSAQFFRKDAGLAHIFSIVAIFIFIIKPYSGTGQPNIKLPTFGNN